MGSLLDYTVGGDVATLRDPSQLPHINLLAPRELYRLWERQNWVSHEIDLTEDRRDWEAMPERQREDMLYGLSAFFVGEERVASQFSGLVLAAADKDEEAFLISQQVDEARHAQYFNRLYEEVFAIDGRFEDRLALARRHLGPEYRELFDDHLGRAHEALLADPGDLAAKVDFVTVYHMVIEGTLALTGQYFQSANLERRGILPGHLKAFGLIARDEHRHVAYGTWFLRQHAADPELAKRIERMLVATLPAAAGVIVPRARQRAEDYEYLGASGREMNAFAFTALSRRLKAIGLSVPAVGADAA